MLLGKPGGLQGRLRDICCRANFQFALVFLKPNPGRQRSPGVDTLEGNGWVRGDHCAIIQVCHLGDVLRCCFKLLLHSLTQKSHDGNQAERRQCVSLRQRCLNRHWFRQTLVMETQPSLLGIPQLRTHAQELVGGSDFPQGGYGNLRVNIIKTLAKIETDKYICVGLPKCGFQSGYSMVDPAFCYSSECICWRACRDPGLSVTATDKSGRKNSPQRALNRNWSGLVT